MKTQVLSFAPILRPRRNTINPRTVLSAVRSEMLVVSAAALLFSNPNQGASETPVGIVPSSTPLSTEALRTPLRTVALVHDSNPARFSFERAEGKIEYAGERAGTAAGNLLGTTTSDPLADAVVGVATAAMAPIAAAKGAIASRKRLSQDKLAECEANLLKAMREMSLQEQFQHWLIKVAHEKCPGRLVPIEQKNTGLDCSQVDAVLQARVEELRLERTGAGDSSYALRIKTRTRLVRAADGAVLHDQPAEYQSGRCLFVDWTLSNAFQNVAETGYRKLAEQIVEQLLATADRPLLVGAGYKKAPAPDRPAAVQLASNQAPLNSASVQSVSDSLADAGGFGIYATPPAPYIALQSPLTREEAGEEAIREVEWMLDGLDKHPNPLVAVPASAVAVPISLWQQGVALVRGLSPKTLQAAEAKLNRAANQSRPREKLAFAVAERLAPLTSQPVMLVDGPVPPAVKDQTASIQPASHRTSVGLSTGQTAARYPVGQVLGTVLEICVQKAALRGESGINPKLSLCVVAQATLRRSRDGQLLRSWPVQYCSEGRPFTKWAAHDAKLFRAELEQCYRDLSTAMVEQLVGGGWVPQVGRPQPTLVKN